VNARIAIILGAPNSRSQPTAFGAGMLAQFGSAGVFGRRETCQNQAAAEAERCAAKSLR